MKPLRLWPQRLVGQVTLVLMLAVALEFIGSSILFENSRIYPNRDNQVRRAAEQLVTAENLLENAPVAERSGAGGDPVHIAAANLPGRTNPAWSIGERSAEHKLRDQFRAAEPSLRGRDLRLQCGA
jgi:hypothetical protein